MAHGRKKYFCKIRSVCENIDRPPTTEKRLVVDIGGGSTEFIIGSGYRPQKLESLYMGCVSFTLRYFGDGRITKNALKQAELAARIQKGYARDPRELLVLAKRPDPWGPGWCRIST
jgi:exopolyphosphatase/guanosine-5'-triphosphate,3'-diphosphate pyrophosphatase